MTTTAQPGALLRGRATTRERLLAAVDALQAERGWSGCTLQEVARRAGLTTGAVYSTFGSRGALLAAALLRRSEGFAGLPPEERDLVAAVAAYARGYWTATREAAGVELFTTQLELIRLAHDDAPLAAALREGFDRMLGQLVDDLERRGLTAPAGASTTEAAQRLVGVLQGLSIQRVALGVDASQDAFVDASLSVLGLRRP